jgi:hypothetical protein
VIGNPSIHAENVEDVHGVEARPFLDIVCEMDVAIELVPRLTRANQVEHLLVQVDHVRALCRYVCLRGGGIVAHIDDLRVLLQHPVERLDPAIVIEVEEVVVGHRPALADVGALQCLLPR